MPNAALAYEAYDLGIKTGRLDMYGWTHNPTDRYAVIDLYGLTSDNTCGTTACLAGWIVTLSGYAVNRDGVVYAVGDGTRARMADHVDVVATDLLGIEYDEAHRLFMETPLEDLPAVMAEIFGPRPSDTAAPTSEN
jgi:hypothetical protein